jgi:hypothetical protein
MSNRVLRQQLDSIARQFKIQTQQDWYSTSQTISQSTAFNKKGSLFAALQTAYPEFKWLEFLVRPCPRSYWRKKSNHKKVMDWIAEKLDIQMQQDWYDVTGLQVKQLGAKVLINKYYSGSLFSALQSIYPQYIWDPQQLTATPRSLHNCFPANHWKSHSNQRELFDKLSERLNIQTQEDWYCITVKQAKECGAESLLSNHYNNSLYSALVSIYPEFQWDPNEFVSTPRSLQNHAPCNHWKDKKNQRELLDSIASQLGISKQQDWYGISVQQVKELSGHTLIRNYYNSSLFSALKSIYDEFEWKPMLFHKVPRSLDRYVDLDHFKAMKNQRALMDRIASQLEIETQDEWYNVPVRDVKLLGAGTLISQLYDNSMFNALQCIYTEYEWNPLYFSSLPRSYIPKVDARYIRNTLDDMMSHLGISDWNKITSTK